MTEHGIHPEDAAGYAADLHRDLERIAAALERLAEIHEGVTTDTGAVSVAQSGAGKK